MGRAKKNATPSLKPGTIPAPSGINTMDVGPDMPPSDAIYLYNLIKAEYGLRSRLGYREYVTGLTGATDNTVRTTLGYTGSKPDASNNRMFVTTSSGIFDVSAGGVGPWVPVIAFPDTSGDAGWGTGFVVTTLAGHFMVYVDEVNGYYLYTENTNTWAKVTQGAGAGQVNGVNPANFCHAVVWNNHLFFTEKNTGVAWYLGINAVTGDATGQSVNFGARFTRGGSLVGCFNWTYDGGQGISNFLVGISDGGDVVIYGGVNPSDASSFYLRGVWSVGGVPRGRRIVNDYGGDLLIMSSLGIVPVSELVIGKLVDRSVYLTSKIANVFNTLVTQRGGLHGWSLQIHPNDNALLVTVPVAEGQATVQLAMNLTTKGWTQYRDLPILSAGTQERQLYFGTADGRVCISTDYLDDVKLADGSYTPIQISGLTRFFNLGNALQKRVASIRPRVLAQGGAPTINVLARFNYDFDELTPVTPAVGGGDNTWDFTNWDEGIWSDDFAPVGDASYGSEGMGSDVAVAFRGSVVSRTSIVQFDVLYDEGGFF